MPARYLTLPEVTDVADTDDDGGGGAVSLGGAEISWNHHRSRAPSATTVFQGHRLPSFIQKTISPFPITLIPTHLIKESEQTLPTLESGRK